MDLLNFRAIWMAGLLCILMNSYAMGNVFVDVDASDIAGAPIPIGDAFVPGAVVVSGGDITLDLSNYMFGGFIYDLSQNTPFPFFQFNEVSALVAVDFTIGADNTADSFFIDLVDNDGGQSDSGDVISYLFTGIDSLSPNTSHTLTAPVSTPFNIFGAMDADGIINFDANGGLAGIAVLALGQQPSDRIQISVHEIRIESIPEPSTAILFSVFAASMSITRRRKAL